MQRSVLLLAILCFPLVSCVEQTLQRTVDNITPNVSAFNPTTTEMHGIVLTVNSCSLNDRTISCNLTATSKYQDRNLSLLGGNYVKVQDDTGVSYPTFIAFGPDAKNKSQRVATMIADTPYNVSLFAENISTQATKVRAIHIERMDVTGTGKIGYIKTSFANPPMRQASQRAVAAPTPSPSNQANYTTAPLKSQALMDTAYYFMRLEPINESIPIEPIWKNGVYVYLNPNGTLGHNWSKPGTYAYVPGQVWKKSNNSLQILFGTDLSYTFDLSENKVPLVTYLDQGGTYKMSLIPKRNNEK